MTEHDYLWDPEDPPDPDVARLEAALRPYRYGPVSAVPASDEIGAIAAAASSDARTIRRLATPRRARTVRWLAAAGLVLAAVIAADWMRAWTAQPWRFVLEGPARDQRPNVESTDPVLRSGAWLVTDERSTARLNVGHIGEATIGPSSRLQLARAEGSEHRLVLQRGQLHARIWAPPRFFLVETPSATAVDLGCVYTLTVDSVGNGILRVESGEVELVRGRSSVLVPAGNMAALRREQGPGLPVPTRASASFRERTTAFDAGAIDSAHVSALLLDADSTHTITLWHMLDRVGGAERSLVITQLVELVPLPESVSLEQVQRGDATAMRAWREVMAPGWSSESVPAWKQGWRWMWRAIGGSR
ncbi:MAG TPA: hypothetical protein VKA54_05800 [Gemmatimonadaceae bacterium]|nr:hypothetical protein [Gemmatimonadaceae bacterium]